MKQLLPDGIAALGRFARRKALLAFDFDGTLAPICEDPALARLEPRTLDLLGRVAALYDCAVLSGRAEADVVQRLQGIDLAFIAGNHGIEPWSGTAEIEAAVGRWRAALATSLAGAPGVEVEDKRFSLAIHYRRAPDEAAACAVIDRAVAALGPIRRLGGKQVLNVLPAGMPTKGDALARIRVVLGCEVAIYVGDDETDEDVFSRRAPWLFGIRVGPERSSAAEWHLRDQREIDALLEALWEMAIEPVAERPTRGAPSNAVGDR